MEADRAASHVEFFAKACTAIVEVEKPGGTGSSNQVKQIRSATDCPAPLLLHITLVTSKKATFS
jgi:hypothetical protein